MSGKRVARINPVVIRHLNRMVFHNGAGLELCIPSDQDVDYVAACLSPGKILVDKSEYVALSGSTSYGVGWLPTVRRPKGFGKTMFLSLTEHFADLNCRNDVSMPFLSDGTKLSVHMYRLPAYHGLAVVHLDFSELHLVPAMNETALRSTCRSFLSSAATACYRRYLPHFQGSAEGQNLDALDFKRLMKLGELRWMEFYVGIDNYTSPLSAAGISTDLVEAVIVQEIFQPIFDGRNSGLIMGGFMVGCDLPPAGSQRRPYSSQDVFRDQSFELSNDYAAFDLLGLREAEIVAIGNALFDAGPLLLRNVRIAAALPAVDLAKPCRSDRSYGTRDVLAIVRAMQASPDSSFPSMHVHCVSAADYPVLCVSAPMGTDYYDFHSDIADLPSDIAAAVKSLFAAEAAQHTVPASQIDQSSLGSSPSLEDPGSSASSNYSSLSISSLAGGFMPVSPALSKSESD